MDRHDEDPTTDDVTAEPRVEPTVDEQVHESGDKHDGLEGGVDVRPPSARENLRLT
jgi:hypothetical protein